jgi:hypothetical protein
MKYYFITYKYSETGLNGRDFEYTQNSICDISPMQLYKNLIDSGVDNPVILNVHEITKEEYKEYSPLFIEL